MECPVCGSEFESDLLPLHVEQHFTDDEPPRSSLKVCQFPGCGVSIADEEMDDHMLAHSFEESAPATTTSNHDAMNDSLLARLIDEEGSAAGSSHDDHMSSDETIARQIQKENDKKLEEENFRQLQDTYGMGEGSKGGYTKQFEDTMDRRVGGSRGVSVGDYYARKADHHAAMITGHDSNRTRTRGVVPILKSVRVVNNPPQERYYAVDATDHFAADTGDGGWGCGYRNIQMLISALLSDETYAKCFKPLGELQVPSIPTIQLLIERAWADGYDRTGRDQLGGKLSGSRKWVGTTEAAALFRWLRIRACVVDFHRPTGEDNQHKLMFEWIFNYFKSRNAVGSTQPPPFPLYIQHQGHSRTCVGCKRNSKWESPLKVVIFDPSCGKMAGFKTGNEKQMSQSLKKSLKQMKQKQFQVLYVDGVLETAAEIEASKVVHPIRIPP